MRRLQEKEGRRGGRRKASDGEEDRKERQTKR